MAGKGASGIVVRGKVASGFLADHFGWDAAFYFLVLAAVIAAIFMMLLWKYKPEKRLYQ